MKLKQIKEFNKETVTNDIAFEIFAIAGCWNHYREEKHKSKGFEATEKFYGQGKGSRLHSDSWNNPNYTQEGYVRTYQGLWLIPNKITAHQFSLDKDGSVTCWNIHKKGDLRGWSLETGYEYYDEFSMKLEYPAHQIELLQLYLDYGFYTIEP